MAGFNVLKIEYFQLKWFFTQLAMTLPIVKESIRKCKESQILKKHKQNLFLRFLFYFEGLILIKSK